MNIAFDSVAILGPMSKNRGIGNYAESQFKTLLRFDKDNHYFFFNIFEDEHVFQEEDYLGRITEEDFLCVKGREFFNVPCFDECFGMLVQEYIKKNHIDVFYITSPFDSHIPPYRKEWLKGTTVVATVYDIIPYIMRDHYFPNKGDINWFMERIEMLRWVDRLLVISQSVKDDLVHYLHFDPNKIDVIWGAPSDIFRKLDISTEDEARIRGKYNTSEAFVMCTGGDDERKNIAGLIKAFSKLPKELLQKNKLVIVCKLQQASVERYSNLAKEYNIGDRVILTNYVPDEELIKLYNLANLVAFPSLYEGFGLPVVEAWACGTGVLTSNNSSLVEIAGDAAITVNPYSINDITRGLQKALTSDLQLLAKKGEARLHQFSWHEVAKMTMESVDKAARENRTESNVHLQREKIAFFSPLPPMESGISDYSADIMNALVDYFDIDVYIDDRYSPDFLLNERIHVFNHREYNKKRNKYYETVYQMGNSLFHDYMWPYIRKWGGLVVLHDYNMHGVLQAKYLGKQNKPIEYQKALMEDYAEQEVKEWTEAIGDWPKLDLLRNQIEVNGYIVNHAGKIIVHSDEAKKKLLEKNIGRNVRRIRHYAVIKDIPDIAFAKSEIGLSSDTIVIASFGGIHETKRAIPILRAFAKLVKEFDNLELIFGGRLDSSLEDRFTDTLEELDIKGKVRVTGYQDLDTFLTYMDATDICLNLRWPYNGETSGTLMRMLAKGKCVVVNDIGSFSEVPDNAIVKLPSVENISKAHEIQNIYEALYDLCKYPEHRRNYEEKAREYAEKELDIKVIAKQYADFILEKKKNLINEDLLNALHMKIRQMRMTEQEVSRLARTLSFIKM